jgi:hypothetical protein
MQRLENASDVANLLAMTGKPTTLILGLKPSGRMSMKCKLSVAIATERKEANDN